MEAETRTAVNVDDLVYEMTVHENVPNPLYDPARDEEQSGYYGSRPRQPKFITRRVLQASLTREEFNRVRDAAIKGDR